MCSTASDYMRFCQMLKNGGEFNGVRLLKEETVGLMTTDKLNRLPTKNRPPEFGFGFTIFPDEPDVHEQLRGAYAWFGYWTTSFRVSPRGDWVLITMSQRAWDDELTPAWFYQYEQIAAEAIK